MKKLLTTAVLAVLIATGTFVKAQDWPEEYLGLPGDNLNLYAVMDLFRNSETLEGFERALNSEDAGINNLDLNGDNLVDYIMVTDYVDGNVHNIVLRVALNKRQKQDVAVFTVERHANGSVDIQLVGDEVLYGRNYIIEPFYDSQYGETANPGYQGAPAGRINVTIVTTSAWEVAGWPMMRHLYLPGYVVWHSRWDWGYWPAYWTAWHPWYWHYYYGYHCNWFPHYYAHFRPWHHFRYHRYHDFYYAGVRNWSKEVYRNIHRGYYKESYSRPELKREGQALYGRVEKERNSRFRETGTDVSRLSREVSENARVRSVASGRSAERTATRVAENNGSTVAPVRERADGVTRTSGVSATSYERPAAGRTSTVNRPVQRSAESPARTEATMNNRQENESRPAPAATRSSHNRGNIAAGSTADLHAGPRPNVQTTPRSSAPSAMPASSSGSSGRGTVSRSSSPSMNAAGSRTSSSGASASTGGGSTLSSSARSRR